jgi:universal stress protein A
MSEGLVVVGIGLTSESGYVLEKVVRLAGDPDRILAVHVLEQSPVALDDYGVVSVATDVLESVEDSIQERLERLCRRFGVKRFQLLRGHPAGELHRMAKEHDAQLIAVGTHGRQGWRALLGETANAVLHGTPTNVLAVYAPDELPPIVPEYRKILVAVDLSVESDTVIEAALRVQERFQSEVTVLSVFKPINLVYDGIALSTSIDAEGFDEALHDQVASSLCEIIKQSGLPNAKPMVRRGDPTREIHTIAQEIGADLIVLGTHGTSGPALLLGSTPNAVLHGVRQDVLAVRVGE